MVTGMLHLHNFLRWVILVLLVLSIIKSLTGWRAKEALKPGDKKLWLFTMIAAHTTFLIGIYLLLFGRLGIFSNPLPAGESFMKNSVYRFFWLEHPLLNLIAIVLITIGRGQAKKSIPDATKYRKAFIYFVVALIVLLASVPWPSRELVGRPMFPGM